jgi:hypothetical protein
MPPGPPQKNTGNPGQPVPQREETRLESDEEIRAAILARRARQQQAKASPGAASARPVANEVKLERPTQRPPMATLCALDDGKLDGEIFRVRADRTVLGRAEGDVRIPHDPAMSGRHAEIVRQQVAGGGYSWMLVDLQSTNGTFVRVAQTVLGDGSEFLVGGGRYRFVAASLAAGTVAPAGDGGGGTRPWAPAGLQSLVPMLVEDGTGQRYPLTLPEYWIGRDPAQCTIARPDDPLANARHARLFREGNQWQIENHKSLNGLWLRIAHIPLAKLCQFRLGEQRFVFRRLS